MIIFGSRAAHVATKQLKHSACPNCGDEGTLSLSIFRKHAHVFWIPMFPYGKTGVSQCSNCKNLLKKNEMPERVRGEYEKFKAEAKGPIWQFSGLFLIAIFVVFGIFQTNQNKQNEEDYLSSPSAGDIYYQKLDNGHYTTMRVTGVVNDSIVFQLNQYEIDKMGQVYKIEKDENYAEQEYAIHSNDLKEMYRDDEIYRIRRK